MKIDKIIFTCSEQFSPFWNIQSRIWKTKMGIEPVCLLFGKKSNTNMNEEFGKIHEFSISPDATPILQITMSKFIYPATEPDTTWLIGDIDMLPLQTNHFVNKISHLPDDDGCYAHLNFAGISWGRRVDPRTFFERGGDTTGGVDVPGHYHVAKGKLFGRMFSQNRSLVDVVNHITEANRYGIYQPNKQKSIGIDVNGIHGNYWCAEENYTSEVISQFIQARAIRFYGVTYDNRWWPDQNGVRGERIDRAEWNNNTKTYAYDPVRLREGKYVDIHCHRPFWEENWNDADQNQRNNSWNLHEKSLTEILTTAGMLV